MKPLKGVGSPWDWGDVGRGRCEKWNPYSSTKTTGSGGGEVEGDRSVIPCRQQLYA